jgi:OmpA-OmpF porin, OOP family
MGFSQKEPEMASFDQLIQEIGARYHLGPKARPLMHEALRLIADEPGGISNFLNNFKIAGFGSEVASWSSESGAIPLSARQVELSLGSDVVYEIAHKVGMSQSFTGTVLGYTIPRIIGFLAPSGVIPSTLPPSVSRFLVAALPRDETARERADRIPSRRMEGREPPRLDWMLIPGAALLVTLGLLGFFIASGKTNGPALPVESTPVVVQNTPALTTSPRTPTMPARLSLRNQDGHIFYSGRVEDNAARTAVLDALKTVFEPNRLSGEITVDPQAAPAEWARTLRTTLENFKAPGSLALFEGNAVRVGGAIPSADRDRILASLKSDLGTQFTVAAIEGGSTKMAAATPRPGPSDVSLPYQPTLQNKPTVNFPTIYFPPNATELPRRSTPLVRQVAGLIKQLPAGTVVEIGGFTNGAANLTVNMQLSQERADAVRRALVREGVDPAMLSAKGYGSANSMADNAGTLEGRSNRLRNQRRVEFRILQP